MKKFIYPVLVVALALSACHKEFMPHSVALNSGNSGSIVMAPNANGPVGFVNNFNSQDSLTAIGLMNSNNLSTNGFVFYFYESYNALNQNNQAALFQVAEARQIRNGLPVFFEDITFGFENGKLNGPYPASQFIPGDIALDNKPSLSLDSVRAAFIKADNAGEAYNISIGDSTLVAQLGYYNLNIDQLASGGAPNYIKAWYVHTSSRGWPQGYIRDDNGTVLGFTPLTHSGPVTP
jgi:hypothetical protein